MGPQKSYHLWGMFLAGGGVFRFPVEIVRKTIKIVLVYFGTVPAHFRKVRRPDSRETLGGAVPLHKTLFAKSLAAPLPP